MAYTSQQLITNAFYLSNILSREFETISNANLEDGLFRLNGFLAMKGAEEKLVPYYQVVNGNFIAGQEKYFIPNLIEVETLTFFLQNPDDANTIRFPMREMTRYDYFGSGRAEQIDSLPATWRLERVLGGANLYVYYLPQQNYPYQLTGKYALTSTVLNQDLSVVYDTWYLEYLLYGLADYLCQFYSVITPASVSKQLAAIENYMRTLSPMDLTFRKTEYLSQNDSVNYATAHISRGYTVA